MTWLGIVAAAGLAAAGIWGFRNGFIREAVSALFVVLAIIIVAAINPYVNEFLYSSTPLYETVLEKSTDIISENTEEAAADVSQQILIDSLGLPGFIRDGLEAYGNGEMHQAPRTTDFAGYAAGYIASAVVNGVSFLLSYLLASIVIKTIAAALDVIARLPVLNGVNKLAGAALGVGKYIVFIWIALLFFAVLCNTEIGRTVTRMVEKDAFLCFLSDHNPIADFFMSVF